MEVTETLIGGLFHPTYGLAVECAPETFEGFLADMRQAREALLRWKIQRGDKCESVLFSIAAEPDQHARMGELLATVYNEEKDLSPLLKSLRVEVAFLDPAGREVSRCKLGQKTEG